MRKYFLNTEENVTTGPRVQSVYIPQNRKSINEFFETFTPYEKVS